MLKTLIPFLFISISVQLLSKINAFLHCSTGHCTKSLRVKLGLPHDDIDEKLESEVMNRKMVGMHDEISQMVVVPPKWEESTYYATFQQPIAKPHSQTENKQPSPFPLSHLIQNDKPLNPSTPQHLNSSTPQHLNPSTPTPTPIPGLEGVSDLTLQIISAEPKNLKSFEEHVMIPTQSTPVTPSFGKLDPELAKLEGFSFNS